MKDKRGSGERSKKSERREKSKIINKERKDGLIRQASPVPPHTPTLYHYPSGLIRQASPDPPLSPTLYHYPSGLIKQASPVTLPAWPTRRDREEKLTRSRGSLVTRLNKHNSLFVRSDLRPFSAACSAPTVLVAAGPLPDQQESGDSVRGIRCFNRRIT
ncbi:hypothetical protein RRG08_022836 [Elysia crispata]|uniref:Uncharacterized protein n=1 Tax=Elysia crispata TaxID=231223 RepID=A0AAE0Z0L4_9GAST|nr:hypothetical protein RRG08_022836 [Elysia crispata]